MNIMSPDHSCKRKDSSSKPVSQNGRAAKAPRLGSIRDHSNTQQLDKDVTTSSQLYGRAKEGSEPQSTFVPRFDWVRYAKSTSIKRGSWKDPAFTLPEQYIFAVALQQYRDEQDTFTSSRHELPANLYHMIAELLPGRNVFECLAHHNFNRKDGRFVHISLVDEHENTPEQNQAALDLPETDIRKVHLSSLMTGMSQLRTRKGRAVISRPRNLGSASKPSVETKLPKLEAMVPLQLHISLLEEQIGEAESQRLLEPLLPDRYRDGEQRIVTLPYLNTGCLEPEARRFIEKNHGAALNWLRSGHFLPLLRAWYLAFVDDESLHDGLEDFLGPENGPWSKQVDTIAHWIWRIMESNQDPKRLSDDLDSNAHGEVIELCAKHVMTIVKANAYDFRGSHEPSHNPLLSIAESARPHLIINILFCAWNGAKGNGGAFWTCLLNSPLAKVQEYSARRRLQQYWRLPSLPAATLPVRAPGPQLDRPVHALQPPPNRPRQQYSQPALSSDEDDDDVLPTPAQIDGNPETYTWAIRVIGVPFESFQQAWR